MTKTISFTLMHFTIAFAVVYAMTGSLVLGGAVAVVEPALNSVAFHFHEKVWKRIEQRRQMRREQRGMRFPPVMQA
ncbi:DUF2061 domain-containing protein [Halopseudomonas phragmitis]|uniref:DUF2061 domain-containing protein n=2 Tax=Pseudomonadaceae TaxID=135621 RepID=A0A1V0B8B2_9GAMM|nr:MULTISPECIES: DUF2061 domain-containing protein [Pseudomonadaceae]AQZ96024.1 hypothetical protein BVH74_15255 [Halopseudomonas phragmitis]PAU89189.1 DUF2061 domain-containing protein [Pseudomonas sp. WN033]RHW20860.1 DUF2061 domain-containing protein [Pseudomonas jilinensis]